MSPVRDFDDTLKELLTDPEQAVHYLRAAMEEGDSRVLALAIQDVRYAQGSGAGGPKPLILNFPFNGLG